MDFFRRVLCAILVVCFVNPSIVQSGGSRRTQREYYKGHDGKYINCYICPNGTN